MITAQPASREDIARIMFDDEIFDRTNADGIRRPKLDEFYSKDLSGWTFIGTYINGAIAGLFIMNCGQLHFWVLKEFRRHAKELLDAGFECWRADAWCEIPALYKSVINFAKNYGFHEMGTKKGCFMKNGVLYDSKVLRYKWAA